MKLVVHLGSQILQLRYLNMFKYLQLISIKNPIFNVKLVLCNWQLHIFFSIIEKIECSQICTFLSFKIVVHLGVQILLKNAAILETKLKILFFKFSKTKLTKSVFSYNLYLYS